MNTENQTSEKQTKPSFTGILELLDATWSLGSGRMVEFRLIEEKEERIHPFKHYTKRRGDRAGTRFSVEIQEAVKTQEELEADAIRTVYLGEMMLANWSDGSIKGQSLKMWIDEEANVHPFAGYDRASRDTTGQMFVAAFWELDDDDTQIDQDRRKRVEGAHRKQQTTSQVAFMVGRNERFHQYLSEKVSAKREWDETNAAQYVRWVCCPANYNEDLKTMRTGAAEMLESRSELDRNPKAANLFHELVRRPFAKWGGVE